jgi:hypothetical protein
MEPKILIEQLEINSRRIRAMVEGVSDEQAHWKPDAESWSILEVVNHLYDEERQDFRVRLDIILHRPGEAWPPIDPQGWVTERQYNQRNFEQSIENFLSERRDSLKWLKDLRGEDFTTSVPTPWGSITAGDMFASWITHDSLHMRQLVELIHAWIVRISEPYSGDYAGEW